MAESHGQYERLRAIASGGMATVYLGRASGGPHAGRLVAIKVMHRHIALNPDFVMMFLDEARVAARISHPNVVSILDVDMDDAGIFLVMDYVEGSSLHKVLRTLNAADRRLPLGVSMKILVDCLRGLEAAHQLLGEDGRPLQLVHRDVSPQNILVGVDGRARITDFGVAHAESRLAPTTQSGQVKGKYAYMSVEQLRNERVDARSDVYSAGIVLWEMLAGQRLFKGDNDGAVALSAGRGATESPGEVNAGVPRELDTLVMRALARYPDDRFPSAASFADALEQTAAAVGIRIADGRELGKFVLKLDDEMPTELGRQTMQRMAGQIRDDMAAEAQKKIDKPLPAAGRSALSEAVVPVAAPVSDDDTREEEIATTVRPPLSPELLERATLDDATTQRDLNEDHDDEDNLPTQTIDNRETQPDEVETQTFEMHTRRFQSHPPPGQPTGGGASEIEDGNTTQPLHREGLEAALKSSNSRAIPFVGDESDEEQTETVPLTAETTAKYREAASKVQPRLMMPPEPRVRMLNRMLIAVIAVMAALTIISVIIALRPDDDSETSAPEPRDTPNAGAVEEDAVEDGAAETPHSIQSASPTTSAPSKSGPSAKPRDAGSVKSADVPPRPPPRPSPVVPVPATPPKSGPKPVPKPPPPSAPPASGEFRPDDL